MSSIRTDLAMEAFQGLGREALPGVKVNHWVETGVEVTEVIVRDEQAAREMGKPQGAYLTLECAALRHRDTEARLAVANLLGEELSRLVKPGDTAPVLVVGLGNRHVTPDSLGPRAAEKVLVTRHMFRELPEYADRRMRSVCAVAPGVLGVTGVETGEAVEGLVRSIHPCAVVCVDSLAAGAARRICAAVQMTDTGIRPGSGVGNHRRALTKDTLGVDVINQNEPGRLLMSPIIERNSVLPTSRMGVYSTTRDNQDKVEIRIYQGENRYCADNTYLGKMELSVPPAPAGEQSIRIRFTYDVNGLFEAEAVNDLGERARLLLRNGDMTDDELRIRLQELEKLKLHPREQTANREVTARGERLYAVTVGRARYQVGQMLDWFQAQLTTQDLLRIANARWRATRFFDQVEAYLQDADFPSGDWPDGEDPPLEDEL